MWLILLSIMFSRLIHVIAYVRISFPFPPFKVINCLFLAVLGLCFFSPAFLYLGLAEAALCCGAQASHCAGFSLQSMGSRAGLQQLWPMGLVAPWNLPGPGILHDSFTGRLIPITGPPGKSFLRLKYIYYWLPRWLSGKESACQCRRHGFDPWVGKSPWRREWQPTPAFLPGKSQG